jgi:hypothetical protein
MLNFNPLLAAVSPFLTHTVVAYRSLLIDSRSSTSQQRMTYDYSVNQGKTKLLQNSKPIN